MALFLEVDMDLGSVGLLDMGPMAHSEVTVIIVVFEVINRGTARSLPMEGIRGLHKEHLVLV